MLFDVGRGRSGINRCNYRVRAHWRNRGLPPRAVQHDNWMAARRRLKHDDSCHLAADWCNVDNARALDSLFLHGEFVGVAASVSWNQSVNHVKFSVSHVRRKMCARTRIASSGTTGRRGSALSTGRRSPALTTSCP